MRKLDETITVSGQVLPQDVPALAVAGFRMIINNRPDGEQPGQPAGAELAAAAAAAGLAYHHIPVAGGLSPQQVQAMAAALDSADGPVLAFCAAGLRSTYLWALARGAAGEPAQSIIDKAAGAGFDLSPLRAHLG